MKRHLLFLITQFLCVFFANAQYSRKINESNSAFAFSFLKTFQETKSDTENIFISPVSLQLNLSMLLNGTNGKSYMQLQNMLNLANITTNDINSNCRTILKKLTNTTKQVQIDLANSLWYSNQFTVNPSFLKTVKTYFEANIYPAQFNSSTTDSINTWASDKTNGKIKLDLKPVDINAATMMLINVLSFRGKWAVRFDKNNTISDSFNLEDGRKKQIMMMTLEDSFYYFPNTNYSALTLPYGNGDYSITIILPADGKKVRNIIDNFSINDWENIQLHAYRKSKVSVGLPRFTLANYNVDLVPTLKKMGVINIFDPRISDLSKISSPIESTRLYVNFFKQFTFLQVDEAGTDAIATTITSLGPTATPHPSVYCNHPFAIIISENTSNIILFMGRIMNPQSE